MELCYRNQRIDRWGASMVLAGAMIVASCVVSAHDTRHDGDPYRDDDRRYPPRHDNRTNQWPAPRVEVHVDGMTNGAQRQGTPRTEDSGPSICRQAHSAAWSTRQLDCPNPRPAQRSNVWSTSPGQ